VQFLEKCHGYKIALKDNRSCGKYKQKLRYENTERDIVRANINQLKYMGRQLSRREIVLDF
jgi:hypothetical protein